MLAVDFFRHFTQPCPRNRLPVIAVAERGRAKQNPAKTALASQSIGKAAKTCFFNSIGTRPLVLRCDLTHLEKIATALLDDC
ncbi:hypothetical protein AUQ42_14400 [Thalassospira sp. MCCC 1A02491]|nr:hypothetical protein AUQ42_14400 [Thalassospira sp. MCCC 1A02491]